MSYVYLVAAWGGYDPMIMRNTWTLKTLGAMFDVLKIQAYFKLNIITSMVEQLFSGVKKR